jgi:hypothetical protein
VLYDVKKINFRHTYGAYHQSDQLREDLNPCMMARPWPLTAD